MALKRSMFWITFVLLLAAFSLVLLPIYMFYEQMSVFSEIWSGEDGRPVNDDPNVGRLKIVYNGNKNIEKLDIAVLGQSFTICNLTKGVPIERCISLKDKDPHDKFTLDINILYRNGSTFCKQYSFYGVGGLTYFQMAIYDDKIVFR